MTTWSIERVVATATPLFSAASAVGLGWLGTHFPGLPHPDPTDVVALEVAGATSAAAAALKWLHGRAHYTELADDAAKVRAELAKLQAVVARNPTAGPALADVEALLKAHEGQVEASIDEHVPKAVAQALASLFAGLGQSSSAATRRVPVEQWPQQSTGSVVITDQRATSTVPGSAPVVITDAPIPHGAVQATPPPPTATATAPPPLPPASAAPAAPDAPAVSASEPMAKPAA
jgi:hypothetical protein